jgi:hypothetical protein
LDLPGIVEGASAGRGRGRQVVASMFIFFSTLPVLISLAAKTADLILIMLDATKSDEQRRLLEIELDAVGIRLNKQKPDIVFKKRTTGGVCDQLVVSIESSSSKTPRSLSIAPSGSPKQTNEPSDPSWLHVR